jgi:ribose transport system substrate-binding protein
MRKVVVVVALAAVVALAGPAARAEEIGVVLAGHIQGFWRGLIKGAKQAGKEMGVRVIVQSPSDGAGLDVEKNVQLQMIDFLISRGVSAMVLAPDPVYGVATPVSPGVPTVFVDRGSSQFTALSTVATDNAAAGRRAGLALVPVLSKGARVAILRLSASIPSTTAREEGFAALAREQGWEIVVDTFVGHRIRDAEPMAAKALAGHGRLDAVFAPNESVAYGALQVIRAMPAAERPRLVAFDWRPEFRQALTDGTLYATVLQDPFRMGYRSVAAAVAAGRGAKPAAREVVEVVLATRANLNDPAIRAATANYDE